MTLPVTIPNTFANATASIPLANLDANFVTIYGAVNGIGNGAEALSNVTITGGTIENAAVGGSTAAAGSFTTLNTSGAVVFNDAGADVDFRVEGDTDANLLFVDASTDRVGIGTSSPATKFHVSNTSGATQVQVSSDTDVSFSATATGADSTAFMTVLNDARQWTIRVNGSESDQFQIRDSTAGATRMVIDSSGNVGIANGNLVFSTNGTGIDFSASAGGGATSSLLDDYEEGTWTATMTTTGTDFTTTGRSTTGFYTKIGNLVTAFFDVVIIDPSSGTGDFVVTGFPFTSVGGITYVSSMISWGRVDLNGAFTAYGDLYNGTTMYFRYSQNNALSVTLTAADLNGNTTPFFSGSITYRAA